MTGSPAVVAAEFSDADRAAAAAALATYERELEDRGFCVELGCKPGREYNQPVFNLVWRSHRYIEQFSRLRARVAAYAAFVGQLDGFVGRRAGGRTLVATDTLPFHRILEALQGFVQTLGEHGLCTGEHWSAVENLGIAFHPDDFRQTRPPYPVPVDALSYTRAQIPEFLRAITGP